MSLPEGVYSIRPVSMEELCAMNQLPEDAWIGMRWSDGEIADPVLVVEMDVYCDIDVVTGPDEKDYSLEFDQELFAWALAGPENKALGEVALRYAIEFDAPYDPADLRVGGKWVWGGGRGMPRKREPVEFQKAWGLI